MKVLSPVEAEPTQHASTTHIECQGRERPILASASTSPFPRLVNRPPFLPSASTASELNTTMLLNPLIALSALAFGESGRSPNVDSPAVTGRAVCGSGCGLPGQGTQCVDDVCKCTESGQDACGNSDFYYCPNFQTNQYSCGTCTNSVSTLARLPAPNRSAILTQSVSSDSVQSAPRARTRVPTGRSTRAST